MSDTRKLYMAIACLAGTAAVVYFLVPGKWWTEILMLSTFWLGGWWIMSFITGKRRLSLWIAVFTVILLLLRRFELLNWITFGIWLIVIGLISIWA